MIPAGSQRSFSARSSSPPSRPCSPAGPRPVVAAHGVVVGDGGAGRGDRVARRALGGEPLAGGVVRVLAGEDGEVQRGAVGIQVRDVAADDGRRRGERVLQRRADGRVQRVEAGPRRRGLERLHEHAAVEQPVAQVRAGEAPRAPRLPRPPAERERPGRAQAADRGRPAARDVLRLALPAHHEQAALAVAQRPQRGPAGAPHDPVVAGEGDRGAGLVDVREPGDVRGEPGLGEPAQRLAALGEGVQQQRLVARLGRHRPHPEAHVGDHPERALGAQHAARRGLGRRRSRARPGSRGRPRASRSAGRRRAPRSGRSPWRPARPSASPRSRPRSPIRSSAARGRAAGRAPRAHGRARAAAGPPARAPCATAGRRRARRPAAPGRARPRSPSARAPARRPPRRSCRPRTGSPPRRPPRRRAGRPGPRRGSRARRRRRARPARRPRAAPAGRGRTCPRPAARAPRRRRARAPRPPRPPAAPAAPDPRRAGAAARRRAPAARRPRRR